MEVRLLWIGQGPAQADCLEDVRAHLARVFAARVLLEAVPERPTDAYDPRRRQHLSTRILGWLSARPGSEACKVLGVTDVDLFIPVLTFVFGEAQLGGRTAVVSGARLADPRSPAAVTPLYVARLAKECVHELGHTFGLLHCEQPRCVMSRSVSLLEVDRKDSQPCHDCRVRLQEAGCGLEGHSHDRR